ncbi:MAG TPA: hypothetical protein VEV87_05530 [Chitinophagaceae bacterium]|nr:hypothetical protein [Chitinophagaceae bacterium]
MNRVILASLIVLISCSAYECNKTKSGKLKGKLVIKEICSHYVVQVIEGTVDSSQVVNNWNDEKRGIAFDKVFTVGNKCDFPAEMKEGDEFEFSFDPNPSPQECVVCMAYYPTPPKAKAIKIQLEK